jgi:hypothetical protein
VHKRCELLIGQIRAQSLEPLRYLCSNASEFFRKRRVLQEHFHQFLTRRHSRGPSNLPACDRWHAGGKKKTPLARMANGALIKIGTVGFEPATPLNPFTKVLEL